jgi:hypothetical protein
VATFLNSLQVSASYGTELSGNTEVANKTDNPLIAN